MPVIAKKSMARSLKKLLGELHYSHLADIQDVEIVGITDDSRQVAPGFLFVAVPGMTVDGHKFIDQAVAKGCAAVVVKQDYDNEKLDKKIVTVGVPDPAILLGDAAAAFYGQPARRMVMVGLTGTNGKTTTSYLVEAMIRASGGNPGVIGTVTYRFNDQERPAPFTTPAPVELHKTLKEMADQGVTHVVMEVSSHALAQKRLQGLFFDVAAFTNLTRDHLDFHGDMEGYFAGKKKLFTEHLKKNGTAIICKTSAQSDWAEKLYNELSCKAGKDGEFAGKVISCGLRAGDFYSPRHDFDLEGIDAEVVTPKGNIIVRSPLVGDFNLHNILVAIGVGNALGLEVETMKRALARTSAIPGRLERIKSKIGVEVFVDYAHTPDAMENVLKTLRKLNPARLIVIFGCGGDRDCGKRSMMGEVAAKLADVVVVTSDNPRSEDPARIINDIEKGLLRVGKERRSVESILETYRPGYDVVVARDEAIARTINQAVAGDLILISGKGHEDYQITKHGKVFFDDRLEALKHLDQCGVGCHGA